MEENLYSVCIIAFTAVMLLLAAEALIIRLISRLFPQRKAETEWIAMAVQKTLDGPFPGARVVAVEEVESNRNETHASRKD